MERNGRFLWLTADDVVQLSDLIARALEHRTRRRMAGKRTQSSTPLLGMRERIQHQLQPMGKMDEPAGLFPKYQVFKAATGEPVLDCIVLRPDRDRHAWDVLGYYAEAIEDEMPEFSVDLEAWLIGLGRPADPPEAPHHDSGSGGY